MTPGAATMSEPVSFASLGPSLLARKGGARPAMRRQLQPQDPFAHAHTSDLDDLGWNDMGDEPHVVHSPPSNPLAALTPSPQLAATHSTAAQPKADAIEEPEVRRQQESLADRLSGQRALFDKDRVGCPATSAETLPEKPVAKTPRPEPAPTAKPTKRTVKPASLTGRRAAFTLRLDADRHLKLRLASTMRGRSAQQIVTEALDKLLAEMPELCSLARQLKNR